MLTKCLFNKQKVELILDGEGTDSKVQITGLDDLYGSTFMLTDERMCHIIELENKLEGKVRPTQSEEKEEGECSQNQNESKENNGQSKAFIKRVLTAKKQKNLI